MRENCVIPTKRTLRSQCTWHQSLHRPNQYLTSTVPTNFELEFGLYPKYVELCQSIYIAAKFPTTQHKTPFLWKLQPKWLDLIHITNTRMLTYAKPSYCPWTYALSTKYRTLYKYLAFIVKQRHMITERTSSMIELMRWYCIHKITQISHPSLIIRASQSMKSICYLFDSDLLTSVGCPTELCCSVWHAQSCALAVKACGFVYKHSWLPAKRRLIGWGVLGWLFHWLDGLIDVHS